MVLVEQERQRRRAGVGESLTGTARACVLPKYADSQERRNGLEFLRTSPTHGASCTIRREGFSWFLRLDG